MVLPVWLQAGAWGLLAGGALLLGAVVGVRFAVPQRLLALQHELMLQRARARQFEHLLSSTGPTLDADDWL